MRLDVQILHVERIILDELAARLDRITHQDRKNLVGLNRIINLDLQQRTPLRVHGRLPELLRIHLTQTFVTLDCQILLGRGKHTLKERLARLDLFAGAVLAEDEGRG